MGCRATETSKVAQFRLCHFKNYKKIMFINIRERITKKNIGIVIPVISATFDILTS